MKILLVISGSIAAYKSLDLLRKLKGKGHEVTCIISKSGINFVTPLSIAALSESPVYTDSNSYDVDNSMKHIDLSRKNDIIVVAPASADIIAKAAYGFADELASTVLLASNIPVVMAPAMNVVMWSSKTVQRNVEILKSDGKIIVYPQEGDLICGEYGRGKMAEIDKIINALELFGNNI